MSEVIDKLYLELAHVTEAKSFKEIALEQRIAELEKENSELKFKLVRLVDPFNEAEKLEQAERRGFDLAKQRIADPKHYGAMTHGGPVTKQQYETYDDYLVEKSRKGGE